MRRCAALTVLQTCSDKLGGGPFQSTHRFILNQRPGCRRAGLAERTLFCCSLKLASRRSVTVFNEPVD